MILLVCGNVRSSSLQTPTLRSENIAKDNAMNGSNVSLNKSVNVGKYKGGLQRLFK